MPTITPSPQARAQLILGARQQLLNSSPLAMIEALGDVLSIIRQLMAENSKTTISAPARALNTNLIGQLLDLCEQLQAALQNFFEDAPDEANEDDAGNIQIGGITIRKISSDDEAFEDLPPKKPKAPGKR